MWRAEDFDDLWLCEAAEKKRSDEKMKKGTVNESQRGKNHNRETEKELIYLIW